MRQWIVTSIEWIVVGLLCLASFAPRLARGATLSVGTTAALQAAISAVQPGDTIELAPGVYEGPLDLRQRNGTASARVTLHSTGATIRGMRAPGDWQPLSSGVFVRVMEASVDPIMSMANGDGHDQFDEFSPGNVYQSGLRADGQHTGLGFAGWDNFTPGDGQWSYHRTTHVLYVNPYGTDIGGVMVPFLSRLLQPGSYQTFEGIAFEGSRGAIVDGQGRVFEGLIFRDGGQGYTARYGARLNRAPGIRYERWWARWIGRGVQPASNTAGGYCARLFGATGYHLEQFVCEHIGAGAGNCPTCDPPWNVNGNGVSYGRGVDIKQTDGGRIINSTFRDGGVQGAVHIDASWHTVTSGNRFDRFGLAITTGTQTPAGPFQYTIDAVIQDNIITGGRTGIAFDATVHPENQASLSGNQISGTATPYTPVPWPANVVDLDAGASTTLPSPSTTLPSSTSSSTSTSATSTTSSTTSSTSTSSTTTTRPTTTIPTTTVTLPPPTTTTQPSICLPRGKRCRLASECCSKLCIWNPVKGFPTCHRPK